MPSNPWQLHNTPAGQAGHEKTARAWRPKAACDSACLREFREKSAAIVEPILEVGPQSKSRRWKELPKSPAPSLSQSWDFVPAILGAGTGGG